MPDLCAVVMRTYEFICSPFAQLNIQIPVILAASLQRLVVAVEWSVAQPLLRTAAIKSVGVVHVNHTTQRFVSVDFVQR